MFDPGRLSEIAAGDKPAALVTVVSTKGSTPRKAGASMVVIADGSELGGLEGTIGGGAVEHLVRKAALEAIASGRPRHLEISLTKELAMCCGGSMSFFIDPLRLRPPLIVFGAGHVGQALCRVASTAGFDVTVADPREDLLVRERFPDAVELVDDYDRSDMERVPFGPDAYVVVATHDHAVDQKIVELVLSRDFHWAALVGSQRKAVLTRERCLNKGISEDKIAKLRCPAGLDIGAETPEEIALSIVAEMVQVRRTAEANARHTRGAPARVVGMRTSGSAD
jgi:xanthine dehydrogenase accessory factor